VACSQPAASNISGNCTEAYLRSLKIFEIVFGNVINGRKSGTGVTVKAPTDFSTAVKVIGTQCVMPRNLIVYIFYYEVELAGNKSEFYYAVGSAGWDYSEDDMSVELGTQTTFGVSVRFVGVGNSNWFSNDVPSASLFPRNIGAFVKPLFERNW
jgi:hypothetical protein